MRQINKIIVHCSATKITQDVGAEEIRKMHKAKGWSDIGYHDVIRRDGKIESGRPWFKPGAHAKGYNAYSLGVCLEGGVDENNKPEFNFTQMQMEALLKYLFIIKTRKYPDAQILGHHDLPNVTKACPCFNVRAWLNQ